MSVAIAVSVNGRSREISGRRLARRPRPRARPRGQAHRGRAERRDRAAQPLRRHRRSPPATASRSSAPSAAASAAGGRRKILAMNAPHPRRRAAPDRSAGHRRPQRFARACWSAPASTGTSRRRARPSSPPARRSSPSRSAARTSARTRTRRRCSTRCRRREFTYLPNTAGCYTADDAVRTLRLARELLDGHTLVKLEVLGDANTLFPDVRETLKAAETLVARRLRGDGLHLRRSDHRARARGDRLRARSCRSPR